MIALILALTLTWQDNSNNEQGFYILRRLANESVYSIVATVPPNARIYWDNKAKKKSVYCYMVASFIGDQRSYSNEACALSA